MLRLLPILMSLASTDVEAAIARRKRNAALYVIAGFLVVSAWFAGLAAATIFLVPVVGPVLAPLYIGGALLLTAVVIALAIALLNARDRRRARQRDTTPALMTAVALTAAPMVLRSKPLFAALAIAAIGYGAVKLGALGASDNREA